MSFLVVMDVDSTLIQEEVIELLAERAGVLRQVEEITRKAMAGELDFEQSLKERVKLLEGLNADILREVTSKVHLTPGAKELISSVQASGGKIGAVSGGFSQILDPLASELGLDYWLANTLEIQDSKLTGRVTGEIVDAKAKAVALENWSALSGIPIEKTVAIGDGANDILMLQAAGLAIAFRAKEILRPYADVTIEENSLSRVIDELALRAG